VHALYKLVIKKIVNLYIYELIEIFILQTQNLGREPEDVVNPEANKIKGKRSLYSAA
jgi:hypothetical protein